MSTEDDGSSGGGYTCELGDDGFLCPGVRELGHGDSSFATCVLFEQNYNGCVSE